MTENGKKRILVGVSNYAKNCPEARKLLLDKGYELIEIDRGGSLHNKKS